MNDTWQVLTARLIVTGQGGVHGLDRQRCCVMLSRWQSSDSLNNFVSR